MNKLTAAKGMSILECAITDMRFAGLSQPEILGILSAELSFQINNTFGGDTPEARQFRRMLAR
jgi:hypothetical protein